MSADPKQDPVYKALIALGKRAKLDAITVTRHPALLESEEVQRRAGPSASELERAECAETIIRDFVTNHVTPELHKDILQAALGATEQSEGKNIATRISDLTVSNTTFNNVRQNWFEELTRLLHGFPPQKPPSGAEPATLSDFDSVAMEPALNREKQIALSYSFLSLGKDALRLHFAAIGSLLEYELSEDFAMSGGAPSCHKLLFDSLREFRDTCDYWQTIPTRVRQLFYGDPKVEQVDDIVIEALTEIMDFWPLTGTPPESDSRLHYALALALEYGAPLNHEDLYWDVWLPWYVEREPAHIEAFCKHSGTVAAIVIHGAGCNDDAAAGALREMRRAVEARFRSSWDKDIDGQPVPDYVQSFILTYLHAWLRQPLATIVEST